MQDSALSLLPPLVAISVAIWRKNALLALSVGVLLSFVIIAGWQPISGLEGTVDGFKDVLSSTSNLYIITFSLLIGALVTLMDKSGAVNGFINSLSKLNLVKGKRSAAVLPTVIGTSIFTDTNLSMFTAGTAAQRLFDKYGMSRAKLAYLVDSTCSPISILFLINGWGAYVLGLLDGHNLQDSVGVLIATISYNFYAIIAVALAYYTAFSGKLFGPMKDAIVFDNADGEIKEEKLAPAYIMWLPLFMLLGITFALLYVTGDGDIRRGSGSFSVFWAIVSATAFVIITTISHKLLPAKEVFKYAVDGIKKMAIPVGILVLSFVFGDAVKALGTGTYVSQLMNAQVPLFLIAPIIFIVAGMMAFATGTSWGTFAVLIPIAVPVAIETGLPIPFLVAAVLGGGVFGDHASPISDSTVVASIASGCDHFEHVKTQLPYALFGAIVTLILYMFIGLNYS